MISGQMKSFMDSTGGVWFTGGLIGKPAGCFFSTGNVNGGQESVGLSIMPSTLSRRAPSLLQSRLPTLRRIRSLHTLHISARTVVPLQPPWPQSSPTTA